MQASTLLLFLLACVPLILAPGPSVAYILTTTLSSGRTAGVTGVAGVEAGYVIHIIAAVAGVSAVIAASAEAFTAVKLAGVGYLIWLGIKAWRSRDETQLRHLGARGATVTPRMAFRRGFVVGALNPKTAVFFVSFLPQFVRADAGAAWAQMALLGLIFVALATIPDLLWALAGSALRRLLPTVRMKTMDRVSGTVLFGLAGYALTTRRAAS
jgi:threonine/homoserine/homoserine lactone efflux protein